MLTSPWEKEEVLGNSGSIKDREKNQKRSKELRPNHYDLEYESVRQELLQIQRSRIQILTFAITLFAALITIPLGLKVDDFNQMSDKFLLLFISALAAHAIIILSCYFTYRLSRHSTYISTFIAVMHEDRWRAPGWHYASNLKHFDRDLKKMDSRGGSSRLDFTRFYFVLGSLTSFYAIYIILKTQSSCYYFILVGLMLALLAFVVHRLYKTSLSGYRRRNLETWFMVKRIYERSDPNLLENTIDIFDQ